ncbi:MAG TPA: nicotinamide-nucleotide amidohydrolase family protein [Tepidisphaeraceae bacterium]|jgi:PncC family amidohydrolase|nr:nicotinamide-nucleotide amidohydrolase family protein [Tepidisphaeraceae bacterium]
MNAIILSIGDELVLGQTIDTNSAWLSQQLAEVGVGVVAHITVPDDLKKIEAAILRSASECDFLIISGGIGPTEDDLTRQALAKVMDEPLEENAEWLGELKKFFEARGRAMPPINRVQAMIPRGAAMIFNTCGTAAGIYAKLGEAPELAAAIAVRAQARAVADAPKVSDEYMERMFGKIGTFQARSRDELEQELRDHFFGKAKTRALVGIALHKGGRGTDVYITPGVPKEMKAMFTRDILPRIKQSAGGAVILSRTLHTFGLGESAVAEKLGDLMRRDRNPSVGTTVAGGIVSLRINARFPSLDEAKREVEKTEAACRAALGDLIFGVDDQTLQQALAKLLNRDGDAKEIIQAVTTAESCTGGLIAKMLTDVPGTSKFFKEAFVTYSNESKTEMLGVPAAMIETHGAVSEQVVRAMAKGAKARANAAYALAVSGIAGPDGGTPEKPVGTVWIALAHPDGVDARVFLFPGDREMIRDRSAKMALTMLRFKLLEKDMPF